MSPKTSERHEPLEINADGERKEGLNCSDSDVATVVELCLSAQELIHDSHLPNSDKVVEVGAWAGKTSRALADEGFQVYCVDHWKGSAEDATGVIVEALGPKAVFQTFCRNVRKELFRSIHPCVGRSRTWAEIWPFSVAAVFIDADHGYESVRQDIELWWPHVAPGGVLCGHDYELFPGVKRAVDEWWEGNGVPDNGHDGEVWWTFKPVG